MRGNLVRVNIVLMKEQHDRFREFAKRYHGSLSQFLRLAGENVLDENNDTFDFQLRPILENQERNDKMIVKMKTSIEMILRKIEGVIKENDCSVNIVSHDIENLLMNSEKPLSIPEMSGYLPYQQEELVCGIERLLDTFAVNQIKQINSPSKWRLTGDIYEKSI